MCQKAESHNSSKCCKKQNNVKSGKRPLALITALSLKDREKATVVVSSGC